MGRQVLPTDIETLLLSHSDIAEVAVAGVPHDQYNEVAKAFIVLEPASQNKAIRVTENDLQDFVAGIVYTRCEAESVNEKSPIPLLSFSLSLSL